MLKRPRRCTDFHRIILPRYRGSPTAEISARSRRGSGSTGFSPGHRWISSSCKLGMEECGQGVRLPSSLIHAHDAPVFHGDDAIGLSTCRGSPSASSLRSARRFRRLTISPLFCRGPRSARRLRRCLVGDQHATATRFCPLERLPAVSGGGRGQHGEECAAAPCQLAIAA